MTHTSSCSWSCFSNFTELGLKSSHVFEVCRAVTPWIVKVNGSVVYNWQKHWSIREKPEMSHTTSFYLSHLVNNATLKYQARQISYTSPIGGAVNMLRSGWIITSFAHDSYKVKFIDDLSPRFKKETHHCSVQSSLGSIASGTPRFRARVLGHLLRVKRS